MSAPRSAEWYLRELYQREPWRRPLAVGNRVERMLDSVGDGSGTINMATTADNYLIAPPAGRVFVLSRMNVYIEDGVNEKFSSALYGATSALATGIEVTIENAAGRLQNLTPDPIKKIGHWGLSAGVDMVFTDFPAGSADLCLVRWTFKRGGGVVWLDGDEGEFLQMIVPDSLADLVEHKAEVQGFSYVPRAQEP